MEAAIPAFMKIPILHVDHTERPVGAVSECRVLKAGDPVLDSSHTKYDADAKIGDTYFEGVIPEDGDTNDVWSKVEKGHYNKISIYGVRTEASEECSLAPHERVTPCITKAIRLWSFSLVGNNAINPGSYIKIAKSFSSDLCDEFQENTIELIKAAFPDTNMAPDADQQDDQKTGSEANIEKCSDSVKKSELEPVVQDVALIKGEMSEMKSGIDGILNILKKSDGVPPTDVKKAEDEPPVTGNDYITKASLENTIDLIVKAKVELVVSEIKKSYDAKFTEMEKQIEAFGGETIRKGGNTVVLDMDGKSLGKMDNSFLSNFDALEG